MKDLVKKITIEEFENGQLVKRTIEEQFEKEKEVVSFPIKTTPPFWGDSTMTLLRGE